MKFKDGEYWQNGFRPESYGKTRQPMKSERNMLDDPGEFPNTEYIKREVFNCQNCGWESWDPDCAGEECPRCGGLMEYTKTEEAEK